ncbi:MAG TPA: aminotransferase class V-fold PLP-dependent enzyme, partial [Spirochaetia bacterium]|nr:aminotransferase class V-fold PLP-dependent enzyme [Spirochaetia bacterium]
QRIAIVSFNLREETSYLHPRFVTLLLNDLFGIQSRAGCSCAGPYGHRMLHLDEIMSAALRERIHRGVLGLRPGWVRVNFHFLMTDEEVDFLIDAILFVAEYGRRFLPLYTFDVRTGAWRYRAETVVSDGLAFGIDEALRATDGGEPARDALERTSGERRRGYLREARRVADELLATHPDLRLRCTKKDLIPFVYAG